MNLIFARWIRRPIRTSLWTALLIVACMVLSLGFSVYADGKQVIADIKSQFTTVAFPLIHSTVPSVPSNGEDGISYTVQSNLDSSNDYSELLSESPGVLLVDERRFQSAYSSDILPILSAEQPKLYRPVFDNPYEYVMFEGAVIRHKYSEHHLPETETTPEQHYYYLNATIRVDNIVFSHEKQEMPNIIDVSFTSSEPMEEKLIDNEKYMVFGEFYPPIWSELDIQLEAVGIPSDISKKPFFILNDLSPLKINENVISSNEGEARMPTISKLEGSVEEFLSDPENALWANMIEYFSITNHSLPVMGTNYFESLFSINQGNTYISDGRTFTDEEYASGEKVCIIGEALAQANGIEIGDSISLQPYYYGNSIKTSYSDLDISANPTNPSVQLFEGPLGFCADASEYKVIGLYKQNNMWSMDSFCFSPNTVFVPLNSMEGESCGRNSGVYISVVLENGSNEEFMNSLVGTELEEQFLISDQGYSEAAENITKMMNTNTITLAVSVLVFIVIVFFYVALQVGSDNHIYKTMRKLGEDRNQFNSIVFWSNMLPLAVAIPVAGICTLVLKDIVFMKVFGIENTVENSYSIIIVLSAIVLIIAVSILLYLPVISKRSLLQASGAKAGKLKNK